MKLQIFSTATVALLSVSSALRADVILIDENFNTFGASRTYTGGVTVSWSDDDTSPSLFERYDPPHVQRQTDGDYDHDGDGGAVTPQISLLGALEVNDDDGGLTLTGSFTLPGSVGPNDTFDLFFGADPRGGEIFTSTVEIENVTDGRFLLATSAISYAPGGADWLRNDFSGSFIPADAGDTIEIRFTSTGNGGEGLQLTELYLNAIAVPEAGTAGLLAGGMLLLLSLRRFRIRT